MVMLKAPRRGFVGLVSVSTPGKEVTRYSLAILLNFCQEVQCSMVILTRVWPGSLFLLLLDLLFFAAGSRLLPPSPVTCPSSPPFFPLPLFRVPVISSSLKKCYQAV